MNTKDLIDLIERIKNSWDKTWALVITVILIGYIYFQFLYKLLLPFFYGFTWLADIVIPLAIILTTTIIWLFSTKRIYIRKNKNFVLGLILKVDENEVEYKIKKIVNVCTKEINQEFRKIKVNVFPINYKTNKTQVEKYLQSHNLFFDAMLFATVESGKTKNENGVDDKIVITEFSFIGNFDVNQNLQIFQSTINLANDLKIRNLNKDWAYISDNSLNDKKKLKLNFRDTILHYSGIYLIYQGEFKLALEILKSLFNLKLSHFPKPVNGKQFIPKENLAAYRLNNILLNLFYHASIRTYYDSNNYKAAYEILKDCESTFNEHPHSYDHYISLARFAYENGKLEEAINYTQKAKNREGYTIEVLVNFAFFAIIEKNVDELAKLYNKIKVTKFSYPFNFADVIEFLDRQKIKLKDRDELFDFSIAALNTLFLDIDYGIVLLTEFISKNECKEEYSPLIQLANELIAKKIKPHASDIIKPVMQKHMKRKKKR